MFKAIENFLDKMLEIVFKPVLAWINSRPPRQKFILAFSILVIASGIYWKEQVANFLYHANQYYIAFTSSTSNKYLSNDKQEKLGVLIANMQYDLLNSEYHKKDLNPSDYNPWTISQIVVSSSVKKDDGLTNDYNNFLYNGKSFVPACSCWSEFDNNSAYGNNVATAWVMVAQASLKIKLKDSLIDYIINTQNIDGWWSLYPSHDVHDASTLATAWLVLALHENVDNVNSLRSKKINQSMINGLKWLESEYSNPNHSLFDYPNSGEKKESIAVDGLVLHVINKLEPNKEVSNNVANYWINKFDENIESLKLKSSDKYNIKAGGSSGHTIHVDGQPSQKDNVNNYDLPWFIIGVVNAYPNAKFQMKVKMLAFLDDIIEQGNELYVNAMAGSPQPWLASEFLVALREINKDNVL